MNEKEIIEKLTRELTDKGKIIEAGWVGLKLLALPKDASQVQLNEMRIAFFAGAQHLFASIMSALEPGAEPTDKDMYRMDQINAELKAFEAEFKQHFPNPKRN